MTWPDYDLIISGNLFGSVSVIVVFWRFFVGSLVYCLLDYGLYYGDFRGVKDPIRRIYSVGDQVKQITLS